MPPAADKFSSAALREKSVAAARILAAVFRQIKENGLDYRAMSLVYTSLLALIPLLAVSFSVLKAFGADAYLEPFFYEILKPLGESAHSVADYILDSVKKLNVGLLGSIGLLSLMYTSISLLDKIEESFNHIWRIRAAVSRSLYRRFSDYLSFILVGPLLVFTAFGGMSEIFSRINNIHMLEGQISLLSQIFETVLPYLFIVAAFALLFQIIPDAPVKLGSSLFGGLIAGLAWKLVGWLFGAFMSGSAQYHAVYSTFAILILFMVWLYMSWLIVLLGVQLTFFHQYPRYLFLKHGRARLSPRLFERLGLLLMVLVGRRFAYGHPPWGVHELSERLKLPDDWVGELLSLLQEKGYLMAVGGDRESFMPARDFSTIPVMDVLNALRSAREEDFLLSVESLAEPSVDGLVDSWELATRNAVGEATLRDLIVER